MPSLQDRLQAEKGKPGAVGNVKANKVQKLVYEVHLKTQPSIMERVANSDPKSGT